MKLKTHLLALICIFSIQLRANAQAKSEEMVQLVIFTVKPECVKEFKVACLKSLELSLKEEGNMDMKLYTDKQKANVIYVWSRWKNDAAYEFHKQQKYTKSLGELAGKALLIKPEILQLEDLKMVSSIVNH